MPRYLALLGLLMSSVGFAQSYPFSGVASPTIDAYTAPITGSFALSAASPATASGYCDGMISVTGNYPKPSGSITAKYPLKNCVLKTTKGSANVSVAGDIYLNNVILNKNTIPLTGTMVQSPGSYKGAAPLFNLTASGTLGGGSSSSSSSGGGSSSSSSSSGSSSSSSSGGHGSSSSSGSSSGSSTSSSSGSTSSSSSSSSGSSSSSSSSSGSSSGSSSSSSSSSGSSSSSSSSSSGSSSGSSSSSSSGGAAVWPPAVQATPVSCVSQPLTGSHATYNAGPGQTYASLTAVPWLSLQGGDVVNIFYQPAHYATHFAIQAVGTASAPIVINGVTDANCNRPVIDGAGAVESTDELAAGFWNSGAQQTVESEGVIVFVWGPKQAFATLQSYITIQNVEVTGGKGTNHYTNHSGQSVSYDSSGTSGIYAVAISHVTFQYDTITGNDEGIFVNSQDDQRRSDNLILRGNDIFANGQVGNQSVHATYVQGLHVLYEGNFYGANIAGSEGGALKDRSSGTVIRNNYVQCSLRCLDLVDSETVPSIIDDPLYSIAWVYGNIIDDDCALAVCSGDLIHWGGDSDNFQNYHDGTLLSYDNTIVIQNDPNGNFTRYGLWDLDTNSQSVDSANDVIVWRNMSSTDAFGLGICCGTINLQDTDWIQSNYTASAESSNTVTLNKQGTVIAGTNPGLNADFTLSATSGSPLVGAGVPYPPTAPSGASQPNLLVKGQYANTSIGIVARPNVQDLGAYAAH